MRKPIALLLAVAVSILPGCGNGTMQDITTKAQKAKTKAQLEAALGKPTRFEKIEVLGVNTESWTYKAKDGEVNFVIINDRVTVTGTEAKTDSNSEKADIKSKQKSRKVNEEP